MKGVVVGVLAVVEAVCAVVVVAAVDTAAVVVESAAVEPVVAEPVEVKPFGELDHSSCILDKMDRAQEQPLQLKRLKLASP